MSRGLFITLEGIEGAGKSTQAYLLALAFEAIDRRVVLTREPGGGSGPLGPALRGLLKDPDVWANLGTSEIFLYGAARAHHLESLIDPELAEGSVVICDRYLDSTRAYQGDGRGRPHELIESLHSLPPLDRRPHRTILLDLEAQLGIDRARRREPSENEGAGYDDEALKFFERVRAGFLSIARREPDRIRVIPATGDVVDVHESVIEALQDVEPRLEPVEVTGLVEPA